MDFVVRESCYEIRALARRALKNNWKRVAFAMGVFYLLLITLPTLVGALVPAATYTIDDPTVGTIELPFMYALYFALLAGAFNMGMYSYLICFVRRKDIHIGHIFDGFPHVLKALWLSIVTTFFIFLWSLLLIVPGIIAAFRYSQAFAVLADHPEYSVGQCMGVSKQYMKMNKGKFFCLGLSFIGWALLASLPSSLAELAISLGPVPYLLISFVANIPNFFYMAYMLTAEIIFYELVSKNLVAAPKNKPMTMPTAEGLMEQPAALPVVEKQESEDDFQF